LTNETNNNINIALNVVGVEQIKACQVQFEQ